MLIHKNVAMGTVQLANTLSSQQAVQTAQHALSSLQEWQADSVGGEVVLHTLEVSAKYLALDSSAFLVCILGAMVCTVCKPLFWVHDL